MKLDDVFERADALLARRRPEQFAASGGYPWGGSVTIAELLTSIYEHQDEHTAEIEAGRGSLQIV